MTYSSVSHNMDVDNPPSDVTTVVHPLSGNHTHTVIFLHGREDFGSDLAQKFFHSRSSDGRYMAEIFPTIKRVFPTSRLRCSAKRHFESSSSSFSDSLDSEEIISQWFDIWDINAPEYMQELMVQGLRESCAEIEEVIREESQHVPLERIMLGGMNLGCATAMYTLLKSGIKLGGFIGLGGFFPFQTTVEGLPWVNPTNIKEVSQCMRSLLLQRTDGATKTDTDDLAMLLGDLSVNTGEKTPLFFAHSQNDDVSYIL